MAEKKFCVGLPAQFGPLSLAPQPLRSSPTQSDAVRRSPPESGNRKFWDQVMIALA